MSGKGPDRTLVEGIVIMLNDPICMDHVLSLVQKTGSPCLCAPLKQHEFGNAGLDRRWG